MTAAAAGGGFICRCICMFHKYTWKLKEERKKGEERNKQTNIWKDMSSALASSQQKHQSLHTMKLYHHINIMTRHKGTPKLHITRIKKKHNKFMNNYSIMRQIRTWKHHKTNRVHFCGSAKLLMDSTFKKRALAWSQRQEDSYCQ